MYGEAAAAFSGAACAQKAEYQKRHG